MRARLFDLAAVMPVAAKTHKPKASKARTHGQDRQKTRAMHTGTSAWRRLRMSILQRDAYTCAVCGRYGNQVDHIDGNSHNNVKLNLQVLCHADHSAKTARELNGGR